MHYKKLSIIFLSSVILFSLISAPVYAVNGRNKSKNTESTTTRINDADKASLVYLYQEEKMARDLYNKFYEKWGLTVFKNIAKSEQRHMNSVASLASKSGTGLPKDLAAGSFNDTNLQALYNKLLNDGLKSKEEALKAAALVEKTDISDLQKTIAGTKDASINRVLNSLKKGSENHLKAFKRNM